MDNGRFISGSSDKSLILWDVATGKSIRKIRAHAGPVNAVRLNADATIAVSASYDATVKCWDLRSQQREPVQVLNDATDRCVGLWWSALWDHAGFDPALACGGRQRAFRLPERSRALERLCGWPRALLRHAHWAAQGGCHGRGRDVRLLLAR
jgi:hypothetical protein